MIMNKNIITSVYVMVHKDIVAAHTFIRYKDRYAWHLISEIKIFQDKKPTTVFALSF